MMKGNTEPRLYTKPKRRLTRKTTLGYLAADFAEKVLNVSLIPWQRWFLIHALEIVGSLQGEWHFRFRTIVLLCARQNGKTELAKIIALFCLYVLDAKEVLGTAQDLDKAEDTWQEAVDEAEDIPELSLEIKRVSHTNGKKALMLTNHRRYSVKAATREATRGASVDLAILDELREHKNWDGWGAISKSTLAKPNGIVLCMSNAGDARSVVLKHFRIQAHRSFGDPDGFVKQFGESELPLVTDYGDEIDDLEDDALGFFEWSCAPGDAPSIENLAKANPSLEYGFLTERALIHSRLTDPKDVFLVECMCQWVMNTEASMFPDGAWIAGQDSKSRIADDSPVYYGVDVSADRTHASIAVVGFRSDGAYHGELIAYRSGLGWLQDALRSLSTDSKTHTVKVAIQAKGAPISALIDVLKAVEGIEIVPCQGRDVAGWCGRLWDAVNALNPDDGMRGDVTPIYHVPQPRLDLSADTASIRALGDGAWAWDRAKSTEDASPIVALTMAFGAATQVDDMPAESAYVDHDLMFV